MEDTLWDLLRLVAAIPMLGLNPCFNGRYSLRKIRAGREKSLLGLNPCFNGRYSLSYLQLWKRRMLSRS